MLSTSFETYETCHLLKLPQEIFEFTLLLLDPVDVAACTQTCRALRSLVYCSANDYIWRSMFLILFDDPRERHKDEEVPGDIPWRRLLQQRIRARQSARWTSEGMLVCKLGSSLHQARKVTWNRKNMHEDDLNGLVDILADSVRISDADGLLLPESKNVAFLTNLLNDPQIRSSVLGNPAIKGRPSASPRLHVYYALTNKDIEDTKIRGWAREKVYSMAYYTLQNLWGPFLHSTGDRRPDWFHLEAMMIVLARDAMDNQHIWNLLPHDFPVVGLQNARPYTCRTHAEVQGDWAGITGKWYRIVSFLDYNDLWEWNWSGYGPTSLDDADEVVKLMSLDLEILSIGTPPEDAIDAIPDSSSDASSDSDFNPSGSSSSAGTPSSEDDPVALAQVMESMPNLLLEATLHPGGFNMISPADRRPPANSKYPTLYFTGKSTSHALDPPVTRLRGRVDMGEDGTVLWRMTSRFSGHSWVTEGVQVGGIQSQFGVLGIWSELEHEEQGPAGPTWLWKGRTNS